MANVSSNWQDSLDRSLVNRLTRPLRQPGMMKMGMSQRIINRCDRFLQRLPLLSQQMQRWGKTSTLSSDSVPIIYAQPALLAPRQGIESRDENLQSTVPQNKSSMPLIQRKVDSSQALPVQTDHKTITFRNSTDLSSSHFADETTPSLASETPINQSSISSSDIPVITTQPISEELAETSEMQLKTEFRDSNTTFDKRSQLNQKTPSPSIEDEITPINQSSISSSDIPVISPQSISEELTITEEVPLVQEFTSTSEQSLPIIQAKQQNYSRSPSSLPVVTPFKALVLPKQTQPDNDYSGNLNSIKQENLDFQISSKSIPIVTTKPITSQVNLTEQEREFVRNASNYQNQSFNIFKPQINQNNSNLNIDTIPTIPVISPINSPLKPQSLPLVPAINPPFSNSTNQKANLSNQNPIVPNVDSASSTKIFASSSPPTQTFVSGMETQPKTDLDAITKKVERKIMQRLIIESERRGKIR